MSFAWFVWDRAYRGDAVVRRISWEKPEPSLPILGKRGRPKRGEENPSQRRIKYGANRAYILARLDRDGHAELAAKVRAGMLSASAAARAARRAGP